MLGVCFMKKVGVIAEYNPFHNGYLYDLEKVKEMFPNCSYILILIGNFTQKNDNKWNKTKMDLEYGYDLVVELPYLSSTPFRALTNCMLAFPLIMPSSLPFWLRRQK